MRVLVTGNLGHIGSKLVDILACDPKIKELLLIDNLSTQRFPSIFNLTKQYQFYDLDVSDENCQDLLEKLIRKSDSVIHLAAITDAASSVGKEDLIEQNNFLGTYKMAELCLSTGTPLVHISSTSVYGTQSDEVDEDCLEVDLQPQSPYAKSKLKEEKLLSSLGNRGLKFALYRFGTIFGVSTGMRFHTAVNKFCWQAAHNQGISVWRTALDQKRPYLYLGDAVDTLLRTISDEVYLNQPINIVTQNLTVRDIVESIRNHRNNLKVNFVDSPIMNQLSYNVSNAKSKNLGFEYQGNIENGIAETMALFTRLNNAY